MKQALLAGVLTFAAAGVHAQGTLSGDLQTQVNFFDRDSTINAENTPQYRNYLTGSETWFTLRYSQKDFNAFVRFDAFQNSNLYNPVLAYNGVGIGAFSLTKTVGELTFTGGYIYDQIGSGLLFRAYEDRGLLIDNALIGVQARYRPSDNILIKGFVGNQKNTGLFGQTTLPRFNPVIKGINAEADYALTPKIHVAPGIGVLNRTLDEASRATVVATARSQADSSRTSLDIPYNMYAVTAYNTLTTGALSWYLEGAYKTAEATPTTINSDVLRYKAGNIVYTTLSYAHKGYALTLSGKRSENFDLRTSPNEIGTAGILSVQPIIARIRPQRLIARYTPASLNLSELALAGDLQLAPNDDVTITLDYTHINTLDAEKLYREAYGELEWRNVGSWDFMFALQALEYNRRIYRVAPTARMVQAVTPLTEITYRFNEKKSLRIEAEYMITDDDLGQQAFLLAEYNVAPRWSLALSDMYIVKPSDESIVQGNKHFYQFFGAYTRGPHRFTAAYVKQVEGINCSGGVCRYEPAFSGIKFGLTSSF